MSNQTIYEVVIGIEVHCQLKTKSKLFCPSSTQFGDAPNTHISPVNLALPGALPVLNEKAVDLAIMAGDALNCEIRQTSVFSRKNYFYPDLPKGYQISQFDKPICEDGYLDIDVDGTTKRIGITRIHMEEDAGKLLHQGADSIEGATYSLVDLNRAGTPLIEIVSEPDIRSAAEARSYVETLKTIVQHIGVCDGNLEEGSLRADVNISLRPVGTTTFGTRAEIKNVNSFRSIEKAIEVEIKRQTKLLNAGEPVIQETRNFDEATQTTTSLRGKEEAHDYRYFPEPDLPPLIISDQQLAQCKENLPMLPAKKLSVYKQSYKLTAHECKVLMGDVDMDNYFRACIDQTKQATPKRVALWVTGELNAEVKEQNQQFDTITFAPAQAATLLDLIEKGTLSANMAKEVQLKAFKTNTAVAELVQQMGGGQISDSDELAAVVKEICLANMDVVEKIKAGKTNSANFLMGQVMKQTKGRAKPDTVKNLILQISPTL